MEYLLLWGKRGGREAKTSGSPHVLSGERKRSSERETHSNQRIGSTVVLDAGD